MPSREMILHFGAAAMTASGTLAQLVMMASQSAASVCQRCGVLFLGDDKFGAGRAQNGRSISKSAQA